MKSQFSKPSLCSNFPLNCYLLDYDLRPVKCMICGKYITRSEGEGRNSLHNFKECFCENCHLKLQPPPKG